MPSDAPPVPAFEADRYDGACHVCGLEQTFVRAERAIRETYRCGRCRASLREREQARVVIEAYPETGAATLEAFGRAPLLRTLRIYEPGTMGPFRAHLRRAAHYRCSDFYADPSSATREVPHEDLEALSLPDASVDLLITSDVLEHVAHPDRAFAEIARVLRVGGHHVMTVPIRYPAPPESTVRAVVGADGVVEHRCEPAYHGNGKGGRSLVFTDFGLDVVDRIDAVGMRTTLHHPSTPSTIANRVLTLRCTRVA